MNDSNVVVVPEPVVEPVKKVDPVGSVRQSVEEVLSNSGPTVRERVKEHLVNEELKVRTDAVLTGLKKLREFQTAVKKVKPDQMSYDENGKVVCTSYSKAKSDELKKARESLEKMEKALSEALEGNKYDNLKKMVGSGGNATSDKEETAETVA